MLKRKSTVLLCFMLVICLVFSFSSVLQAEENKHGGTLTIGYHIPLADGLDVMATTNVRDEVAQMVFEPLVTYNEAFEPTPILAENFESNEDASVWTIELREGVKFHDGSELTASDVDASFERFLSMGMRRHEFEWVDSWEIVDDYTIQFNMDGSWAGFMEDLAMMSAGFVVMPEWLANELGDEWLDIEDVDLHVGTGPYILTEVEREVEYRFERYEDYQSPPGEQSGFAGERAQYTDEIVIQPIPEDATRSAALFAGEVDLTTEHPGDDYQRLLQDPDRQVEPYMPGLRVYLKVNLFDGQFANDPVLRKAVRAALDLEQIMLAQGPEELWRINTTPRFQEGQWMWDDNTREYYVEDLELAEYLVEHSNYDGETITLMSNTDWENPLRTAPVIQELLQDIGLNVELRNVDTATFFDLWTDFDEWDLKTSAGGSEVAISYLDAASRTRDGERWPDWPPEWDYYLDIAQREPDLEERKEALRHLYRLSIEKMGEFYFGEVSLLFGAQDYVRNVPDWPVPNFSNIWLDQ